MSVEPVTTGVKIMSDEPVFPEDHDSGPQGKRWGGLSKREMFAGMAMQGMVASAPEWIDSPEKCAYYATQFADYLIKHLKEK